MATRLSLLWMPGHFDRSGKPRELVQTDMEKCPVCSTAKTSIKPETIEDWNSKVVKHYYWPLGLSKITVVSMELGHL